jgi:hypothetical protein
MEMSHQKYPSTSPPTLVQLLHINKNTLKKEREKLFCTRKEQKFMAFGTGANQGRRAVLGAKRKGALGPSLKPEKFVTLW